MWTTLFLLWSIPLMLGALAVARWVGGDPIIDDDEFRSWFGRAQSVRLSAWIVIQFAVVAPILFVVGVFHGLILPNFNIFLRIAVPLLTSAGIALLLLLWVRRRAPATRTARVAAYAGKRHATKLFTRLLSLKS